MSTCAELNQQIAELTAEINSLQIDLQGAPPPAKPGLSQQIKQLNQTLEGVKQEFATKCTPPPQPVSLVPLFVKFNLDNIYCTDEADGPGRAEPYLWTVFFKIDGDTVMVNNNLKLQGTATVVGTSDNHGNLGVAEVCAGDPVGIPHAIGHFETTLKPIPVIGLPGMTVGGVAGCIAILMEEDETPENAIAKAHDALNKGISDQLNKLIPTLGISKQSPTDDDLKKIEADIEAAITSAIASNMSPVELVLSFVLPKDDDKIGTGKIFLSHSELAQSVGKPIPLQWHWENDNGEWTLNGSVSTTRIRPRLTLPK